LTPAQSLSKLRTDFSRLGWNRKATGRVLGQLAIHVTMMVGGSLLFFMGHGFWLCALGAVICSFGALGVATNSHTSSHHGTSSSRRVNEWLTYFGYPFCLGFSATYWWFDHVGSHHTSPNVLGVDDDFDFAPMFVITETQMNEATGWKRRYYESFQWAVLLCTMPALGVGLQKNGWLHIFGTIRKGPQNKKKFAIDVIAMLLHMAVFIVLPAMFFGWGAALGLYAFRLAVMSTCLFAILAPAHFGREAPVITEAEAATLDYVTLQTMTTMNYEGGPLVRWFASGLDYQIEHHLFPDVSHVNYPRIKPLVKQYCERNGLPYRSYGFGKALKQAFDVFLTPKPVGLHTAADLIPQPVASHGD
jgi:fatty acid desaturase